MIQEKDRISLKVVADAGTVPSEQAVSIGLIVTELVMNSLKHAFLANEKAGNVLVGYEVKGKAWKLSVSDNGSGIPEKLDKKQAGLGTTLVKALAHQLEANVETVSNGKGTTVTISHAAG